MELVGNKIKINTFSCCSACNEWWWSILNVNKFIFLYIFLTVHWCTGLVEQRSSLILLLFGVWDEIICCILTVAQLSGFTWITSNKCHHSNALNQQNSTIRKSKLLPFRYVIVCFRCFKQDCFVWLFVSSLLYLDMLVVVVVCMLWEV